MANRMTVKELDNKVAAIDSRLAKLEQTNGQILSLLEKFTTPQQTSTPTTSRKEDTPVVTDGKVREFEGKDGSPMFQKGKLTVYSTNYRNKTVWTVAASKVPYTDKKTGEKKSFAPKEHREALKEFMKGKKLVDMSFLDEKGRKVTYQRPLYKTAEDALAAIQ